MTPELEPPTPAAPPTVPGIIALPPQPSRWPTVIGVIAIVLGALGVLTQAMAFLTPLFIGFISKSMPPESRAQFDVQAAWLGTTLVLAGIQALIAILLLVAGIMLLKRRRAGAILAITWAVLRMAVVVVYAYVAYRIQLDTMQAMKQSMPAAAGMAVMATPIAVFSAVVSLAWGWAFPIFMLIWLRMPSVRREVATWTDPR